MRKSVLQGLVTVVVFFVATTSVGFTQGRDIFSVSGVAVDSRADNEFAAKSTGIAKGETDAFRVLLERLTLQRDHDRLPNLDRKSVSALLRDFSVDAEKFGGGRYIATLTVRFKAEAVRKVLGDADIPFAETTSRPVLVLPVFQTAGVTALWEDTNPWFAAWSRVRRRDGLQPLLLPIGDLSDVAEISAEEVVLGDRVKLAQIAERYGAAETMVVVASLVVDQTFGLLRVEVSTSQFGGTGNDQTVFLRFEAQASGSRDLLLDQAATAIKGEAGDDWKQRSIFKRSVERRIIVSIPIGNLGEWLSIRKRLEAIAAVESINLLQLSVNSVELEIAYLGSADQLQLAMAQSDLDLKYKGDKAVWILHSGTGR